MGKNKDLEPEPEKPEAEAEITSMCSYYKQYLPKAAGCHGCHCHCHCGCVHVHWNYYPHYYPYWTVTNIGGSASGGINGTITYL